MSLLRKLFGRASEEPPSSAAPPAPPADLPATSAAALELELAARDRRIEALLDEVGVAREAGRSSAAGAAQARVDGLMRRLAPLLAQAHAMRHFGEGAQPVRAEDALAVLSKIERVLSDEGLARIGEAGAQATFDPSLHQRLSGGDVEDGTPVLVRFPGYRVGDTVVAKALVSRAEPE